MGWTLQRVAHPLALRKSGASSSAITANLAQTMWDGMQTSVAEFGSRVAGLRKGTGGLEQEKGGRHLDRVAMYQHIEQAISCKILC